MIHGLGIQFYKNWTLSWTGSSNFREQIVTMQILQECINELMPDHDHCMKRTLRNFLQNNWTYFAQICLA